MSSFAPFCPLTQPPPPPPNPWGVAAIAFLIGSGVAILIGGTTMVVVFVFGANECQASGDLFCGLGWVLLAFIVGMLAAALAYVVAGVAFVMARMPPGARALPITVFLVAPPAALMVLGAIGNLFEAIG